ncbi:MAG: RnfABCDGE type electron transport complex subunit G [Clostridiaceae bacterium]|nr:RnfABCDGE type electron transport complex subunit G [Clostridiaceae bacterium]
MKREFLRLTLSLTVITLSVALLLGAANAITAEPIARRTAETREAAMRLVLPEADTFTKVENTPAVVENTSAAVNAVYTAASGGTACGWVVETTVSGFGGAIGVTVGVHTDGTVAGIEITSHSETPGLGARSTEDWFTAQFAGLSSGITVSKVGASGNQIDAISGATVTSKAITGAVNTALSAITEMGGIS